jgi:hypothetical protein
MENRKLVLIAGLLLCFACSTLAQGIIANRAALNLLLGGNRADEGFELGPVPEGGGQGSNGLLSSTNNWGDAGLNLIIPGITVEADPNNYIIWWYGNNIGPGTTKTIQANGFLKLDFWSPTSAFGVDLKDYPSTRTVYLAGITVYGADDTTLVYQSNSFDITDPASGSFFGFESPSGIGSVIFSTAVPGPFYNSRSPFIDNLSFSTVPEPSTISFAFLGLGALALRLRKKAR